MATRKTAASKPAPADVEAKPKKAPAPKKAAKKAAEPIAAPEVVEAAEAPKKVPAKAKAAPKKAAPAEVVAEPAPTAPAAPAVAGSRDTTPLPPLAQAVLAGMREGRALEFIFADGEANPPRTFEPRQLTFDALAQAWFVWGWDRRYNAERHHRIDLLSEVNAVEGVGRSAQGPYKEGTPSNQIGGWLGGEPIPVKALLMKQWIFAVKQAPAPFPDFKLVDADEGKATVTFTATDLRAIARWCMQFGDGIQVLEPQRLVDRIKQAGIAWAGKPVAAPASAPAHTPKPPRPEEPKRHAEPRSEHRPEQHREHKREARVEEAKPTKGPKVEVRVERL